MMVMMTMVVMVVLLMMPMSLRVAPIAAIVTATVRVTEAAAVVVVVNTSFSAPGNAPPLPCPSPHSEMLWDGHETPNVCESRQGKAWQGMAKRVKARHGKTWH